MKKILSIVLTACLLVSMCLALTACGHECEFATTWSKDATDHWHACTGEDCTEIADKAPHDWNEGEVTTAPAQEADGIKTFTCKTCGQTKTESVAFTGMTEAEWNAAFAAAVFENCTYREISATSYTGITVNSDVIYKLNANCAYGKMTIGNESDEEFTSNQQEVDSVHQMLLESITTMTPYASYSYDAATKTYKATAPITIASLDATTEDVTLTFAGGKLSQITYNVSFTQSDIAFTATSTVTLSDYGTTVVNPPAA